MESFFLAETTKYLYLLFDPGNFIHGNAANLHGNSNCTTHSQGYIFNTEAHPIDIGAIRCCHSNKKQKQGADPEAQEGNSKMLGGRLKCNARKFEARFSMYGVFVEDSQTTVET